MKHDFLAISKIQLKLGLKWPMPNWDAILVNTHVEISAAHFLASVALKAQIRNSASVVHSALDANFIFILNHWIWTENIEWNGAV